MEGLETEAVPARLGPGLFEEGPGLAVLSLEDQDLPDAQSSVDPSPFISGREKDRLRLGKRLLGPPELSQDLVQGSLSPEGIGVAHPISEIPVKTPSLGEVGEGNVRAAEHPVGVGDAAGRVGSAEGVAEAPELTVRLRVVGKRVAVFPHQPADTPHSTEAVPRSGSIILLFEEGLRAPKRVQGVVQASPDPERASRGPQDVRLTGEVPGLAVGPAGATEKVQGPLSISHGPESHPEAGLGIGPIGWGLERGGQSQCLLIVGPRQTEMAQEPEAVPLGDQGLEEPLLVSGPPEEPRGVAIGCEGLGKHAARALLFRPGEEGPWVIVPHDRSPSHVYHQK